MYKFLKSDIFPISILFISFLIILPFFFAHQGLLSVDTGREFYIASQCMHGQILYKDIFNIYAPLSYQLNALLFLIFGVKINTLYIAGIINSFIIVSTLYLLAKEFLNKNLSFLLSLLTVFSLVFSTFLYNSNITYSFGLIYALSSFLLSLLFLIKYLKSSDSVQDYNDNSSLNKYSPDLNQKSNEKIAYLSCIFAGFSIMNKYEFILFPFILFYSFLFVKPLNPKTFIKACICFILVPCISLQILFLQGLNFLELKTALFQMLLMVNAPTLKTFYSNISNIFNYINQPIYLFAGLLPIINIILFIVQFKKLYSNKPLFIFILSSILASVKFSLFLNINHMGAFLFPVVLLTTIILINQKQFLLYLKYIILIFLILFFASNDFESLKYKNFHLLTNKGNIYTYSKDGVPIKKLSDFILNNTTINDKIVILPEGAFINFITDRKTDNLYHSLIPLYYLDIFKENNVIEHFKNYPADYFIILPLSTIEYGYNSFCDYAGNFCEIIFKNYNLIYEFENTKVFKRKNNL